jgi:predicted nucleic-acid-binding Zn-ribbon protein
MRNTHVCPKCHGHKILLIDAVADMGEWATEVRTLHVARVIVGQAWLSGAEQHGAAGELGAAVCRACGYTEFHVRDPGSIPVDGVHVREVTGPEQTAPYR